MEFYDSLKINTKTLMDDLVFICYDESNPNGTRENMETILYKVSMKAQRFEVFATTSEVRKMISEMTFSEIKATYNALIKKKYKTKLIIQRDGSYRSKTLYELIKEMKNGEKIELCINNDTPKTFKKIKLFSFENNDYVNLKDQKSKSYFYKYEMINDQERLVLVNDKLLLGIFDLLNN